LGGSPQSGEFADDGDVDAVTVGGVVVGSDLAGCDPDSSGGMDGLVDVLAGGSRGEGLGGVAWELALLIVGLDLLGLCESGETIVSLVPERDIIVRAEFFIELDAP
jgi:hypothetical protein